MSTRNLATYGYVGWKLIRLDAPDRGVQQSRMKVARKSPAKRRTPAERATLTLTREIYHKIDDLRGTEPRSTWVQSLIEREVQDRERAQLAETLIEQYTPAVCRETLSLNEEFPVHER